MIFVAAATALCAAWLTLVVVDLLNLSDRVSLRLIVAHPDDEVLFFWPSLRCGHVSSLVCMSDGDFDGLGKIRESEFKVAHARSASYKSFLMKNPSLPDDPIFEWKDEEIERSLSFIESDDNAVITTFGPYGCSGHSNHVALHRAFHTGLYLIEPFWMWKFLGPIGAVLELARLEAFQPHAAVVVSCVPPTAAFFRWYPSQIRWYRLLQTLMSVNSYVNAFRRR